MSASLVGSEMCIRDRRPRPRPRQGQRPGSRKRPGQRPGQRPRQRKLSLIHILTLPTICSV
eukprot:10000744-Alexandrium_andersonii.AAC.1